MLRTGSLAGKQAGRERQAGRVVDEGDLLWVEWCSFDVGRRLRVYKVPTIYIYIYIYIYILLGMCSGRLMEAVAPDGWWFEVVFLEYGLTKWGLLRSLPRAC